MHRHLKPRLNLSSTELCNFLAQFLSVSDFMSSFNFSSQTFPRNFSGKASRLQYATSALANVNLLLKRLLLLQQNLLHSPLMLQVK
ncbi:uncharacterized protein G2W53_023371 [Senna tora]|uniref:Uncharacterized protein n=1 Tax=Senna tora TaxID=362788 RepID=A0A834TA82_9FABA|nr:uncharacterized protein G2W53_023371 [Senna tora]